MNNVETGKVLEVKTVLKVTKETYKDRNINFRKFAKTLMTEMLHNHEFKTLNLQAKTYGIALKLIIIPVEIKGDEIIIVPKKKKLIKVVK